jgi:PGF-pre-PGF domain-containing protein/PGF-CTERM protein
MQRSSRRALAIVAVALMIAWPMTMIAPGGGGIAAANHPPNSDSDDQFTQTSEGLLIWERSILPLRADTDNAETTVPLHELRLVDTSEGSPNPTSANRIDAAVYPDDESIQIDFRTASGASVSQFGNHEAQVIVASVEETKTTDDFSGVDALNETLEGALEGNLTKVQEEARANDVNFTVKNNVDNSFVNTAGKTNSDGRFRYNLDPAGSSGPYVVMLALPTQGDGFDTDDDNILTLPGNATLVGTEMVLTHENPSTLDVSDAEPGDSIDVSVDTSLSGTVNHSVLIYNEEQFDAARNGDEYTEVELQDDFSSGLSDDDIVFKHTIDEVNGVGELTADTSMFGRSAAQQTVTGTRPVADIVEQLNDTVDRDINRQSVSDTTLDASAVAVPDGSSDTTITVETFGNWSEGTYRVIHMANDGTAGGFESNTQTITIQEQTDGTDGTDGDDGTDGADDDDDDDGGGGGGGGGGIVPPSDGEPPADVDVVAEETATTSVTQEGTTATFSEDSSVESVTFSGQRVSGDVTARTLSSEPSSTGPSPGSSVSVTQITVPGDVEDNPATVRLRVSQDRLEEMDAAPEDLRANRFDEAAGEWQGLPSEVVDQNDRRVVVEAETPGFSFFSVSAVSEPDAALSIPEEVETGTELTLDGSGSSNRYGEIVAYEWSVDGDTLEGETATTTIDSAGEYTVELTVQNDADRTDTASQTITVVEPEPAEDGEDGEDGADDGDGETDPGDGEPADDEADDLPGFGVVVALIALLAAALIASRRQNSRN